MHHHFLIHKPYGYLSQFIYQLKRKKKLLGELYDFPENTMAIGRLDEDSEGLLLLTTDGMMSEIVRSKKVEKEYYAQVDGIITEEAVEQLRNGVEIGLHGKKYKTKNQGAQEAHEAIRPTMLDFSPDTAKGFLKGDELKLYTLIYNRFLASQMKDAEFESQSVLSQTKIRYSRQAVPYWYLTASTKR